MNYTTSSFSKYSGISIDTLRYYEKEHLILPARKSNGHRLYTENDMIWIQFIKQLKDTGMTIKEIREYSELRLKGDSTQKDRLTLLIQHRRFLKEKMNTFQNYLSKLDQEIQKYEHKRKNYINYR